MAVAWKTITQSSDSHKFNARNTFLEINLKSSKAAMPLGETLVKIDCWTRTFKMVNNQRIFTADEEYISNIFTIERGKTKKIYFLAFLNLNTLSRTCQLTSTVGTYETNSKMQFHQQLH